jgi:hypothetical protein
VCEDVNWIVLAHGDETSDLIKKRILFLAESPLISQEIFSGRR